VAFHDHPLFIDEDRLSASLRTLFGRYRTKVEAGGESYLRRRLSASVTTLLKLRRVWRFCRAPPPPRIARCSDQRCNDSNAHVFTVDLSTWYSGEATKSRFVRNHLSFPRRLCLLVCPHFALAAATRTEVDGAPADSSPASTTGAGSKIRRVMNAAGVMTVPKVRVGR